ncbi:helix-turn-helix transcriptional regulator [Piscibacillus sp. B03]|uniref:helix-turn-helix transcriptional regulator n=1 Tax=Piscibacillus sp. B03 TaxID=3457430 RepID=UPI003FCE0F3D
MDGYFVKRFRQNLGLTQAEFGREIGVGQQMVSKIETGVTELSETLENRIRYRFNVTEEEIEQIQNLKRKFGGVL